jgi:hypothetical protein
MPSKHVHFAASPKTYSPPTINLSGSPYESSPLPDQGSAQVNYYLTPNTIHHCLLNSPSHATFKGFPLARDVAGQAATSTPFPRLTVLIRSSQFPWSITITPSNAPCVTIDDVLRGIYLALEQPASEAEYKAAPAELQKTVSRAFTLRCQGRPELEKHGLKRVDFLGTKIRWVGLTPTSRGPDVWELHVSS